MSTLICEDYNEAKIFRKNSEKKSISKFITNIKFYFYGMIKFLVKNIFIKVKY